MAAGAIALIAGGSLFSAIGQLREARAKRDQAKYSASLKREQADEMASRTDRNIREMVNEERFLKGSQVAGFAKGGVQLSGSAMTLMEDTAFRFAEKMRFEKLQSDWEVNRLRRTANVEEATGMAMESIGNWKAAGTVLGGAGDAVSAGYKLGLFGGFGNNKSPSVEPNRTNHGSLLYSDGGYYA